MRTTSRSPVLSRRDSPLQGSGQQNNQAGQRNSTRFESSFNGWGKELVQPVVLVEHEIWGIFI